MRVYSRVLVSRPWRNSIEGVVRREVEEKGGVWVL